MSYDDNTVDSRKLEHVSGTLYTGLPSFLSFGYEGIPSTVQKLDYNRIQYMTPIVGVWSVYHVWIITGQYMAPKEL